MSSGWPSDLKSFSCVETVKKNIPQRLIACDGLVVVSWGRGAALVTVVTSKAATDR